MAETTEDGSRWRKALSSPTFDYVDGILLGLYDSRSVLFALVRRNLAGRYRNSYLGFAWQFIFPAVTVLIFYVVFTGIRQNPMEDFAVYLCAGMFPFFFMKTNITQGAGCIVANGAYINKMYFPRSLIVLAQVISSMVVFLISYETAILLAALSGHHLDPLALLCLVPMILLMALFSVGCVLLLSSITVYVRDVQHLMDLGSWLLFWITPIFYVSDETSGILNAIIWSNPLTYFVDCFQSLVYWGEMPGFTQIAACIFMTLVVLTAGFYAFQRLKGGFAERV